MIATLFALAALPTMGPGYCTVPVDKLSDAEKVTLQSIQGIANRHGAAVWQDVGGMSGVLIKRVPWEVGQRNWNHTHRITTTDVWLLAALLRPDFKGAVLCDIRDESLNRAATLAGLKDLIVVDVSLAEKAKAAGFQIVEDARKTKPILPGDDPALSREFAVEQPPGKAGFLRDWAIKHKALCFSASNSEERRKILGTLKPGAWVLGWGPDEYQWISDISVNGGIGCAADWCANLSAMESLGGKIRPPVPLSPERAPKKGERIVAFVLTDGDNVQWETGGMPLDKSYYGNPLRGTFKMTWEVSPLLARLAPAVLDYMFLISTPADGFVAAGAPGYSYAGLAPDRRIAAQQTGPLLKACGLGVVGVINVDGRPMSDVDEILDLPEVKGVVYKDYSPYHGKRGAVYWRNGKPCVGYRFSLWEGMGGASPDEVATAIAKLPADPANSESYALVTVHAWSFGSIGGPIEAVKRTIDKLPPGTRVVTAPELVKWLRKYCAPPR